MPDEKEDDLGEPIEILQPASLEIRRKALIDAAEDALDPDPMSDEIEKLEREAAPIAKTCPHCGKELPTE